MAKIKCVICGIRSGKRKCMLQDGALICPVCCATSRDEEHCRGCNYFDSSEKFDQKKNKKATSKLSSLFGSPQLQKSIMEASIDLMNNHPEQGKVYDKDADKFLQDSFAFFFTDEYKDFSFSEKEIKHIILELGEPKAEEGWFHTEAGKEYYVKAVNMTISETRFRTFSQKLFKSFLKYYDKKDIKNAWLILSTMNRLMEGEFLVPFTILMFFRGISKWKMENNQ